MNGKADSKAVPADQNDPSGPESRRFQRVPLTGKTRISFVGEETVFHAMIDNVNRGGIGVYSKKPLPLDKDVRLRLEFTDMKGTKVTEELQGRIVRVTPWNRVYIIGIAFNSIVTTASHPHLFAYLEQTEKRSS